MASPPEILGLQVIQVLGHGARSTIYQARDPADGQVYALKHVVRERPTDQRFLDQAIHEHEIASAFQEPSLRRSLRILRQRSLLRTMEIGIVMEYVEGLTLEQRGAYSVPELCDLARQTATGLGAMHKAGFVHADIKPSNIMVTPQVTVKIIDFGQSCPMGTIKERIQGTPDYIAPEQVYRRKLTARTDAFNLGATFYWLLTGQHVPTMMPKQDGNVRVRSEEQTETATPPIEVNRAIPPALSSLVMACVDPVPRERPATMDEVIHRLDLAVEQWHREHGTQSDWTAD